MQKHLPRYKSIFLIFLLFAVSLNLQYHFSQQFTNPYLNSDTSKIAMVDDDKMVISQGTRQQGNVVITQGSQLNTKRKQFKIQNIVSEIKVTNEEIYINDGQSIIPNQMKNQIEVLLNTTQTAFIIVNSTTVISASTPNYTMTLTSVNVASKQYFTKTYNVQAFVSQTFSVIKLIDQNTIACFYDSKLFIIDSKSLQIKQKFPLGWGSGQNQGAISSFYQKIGNKIENTIAVMDYEGIFVFSYNQDTEMYQKIKEFYDEQPKSFQLNGLYTGVSFKDANLMRWKDLRKDNILNLEQNFTLFDGLRYLAPSTSENLLVLFNYQNWPTPLETQIYFFSFNSETYEISKLSEKTIILSQLVRPVQFSGKFTEDDKYLFFIARKSYDRYQSYYIGRIKIQDHTVTYIKPDNDKSTQNCNCSNYGLLDNYKLVTLCHCKSEMNETFELYYQIRLYKIVDLAILDTYNISTQNLFESNIKTNPDFDYTIIIQITTTQYPSGPCKSYIYKIQDNKIVNKNISTDILDYYPITDCYKYLVNIISQQHICQFCRSAIIVDISNFQIVAKIPQHSIFLQIRYTTRNIIILKDGLNGLVNIYSAYDLSKRDRSQQEWKLGRFTGRSFGDAFILPQNRFMLTRSPKSRYSQLVLNLSASYIQSNVVTMTNRPYCGGHIYEMAKKGQQCNKIYFVSWAREDDKMSMNIFSDCSPYDPAINIDLNLDFSRLQISLIPKISLTKQYLVFSYYSWQGYRQATIDVRQINDIGTNIYKYLGNFTQYFDLNIDAQQNIFFANTNGLFLKKMKVKQSKHEYSIDKILALDVNDKGCVIFAGNPVGRTDRTKIIYQSKKINKDHSSAESMLQSINLIALDQVCSQFALYEQKNKVIQIWNITDISASASKLNKWLDVNLGNISIQEMSINQRKQIIIRTKNQIYIKNLSNTQQLKEYSKKEQIQTDIKVQWSTVSTTLDGKSISIFSLADMKKIASFNTQSSNNPQTQITGLSFSTNNTLYISLNQQILQSLSPRACPQNYIKQTNLQCVCLLPFQLVKNQCLCNNGYVKQSICYQCSFICKGCFGPGLSCHQYSGVFISIVICGSLVGLALILVIAIIIINR